MYKKEERSQRFFAAIQGIDLDKNKPTSENATTLQQVQARAQARLGGDKTQAKAIEYGFTKEVGLSYEVYGVDNG